MSFEFPSSLNVYGPAQVEAAINQDPVISAQRTLWGQQGSHVIFGNLLTIPIEDSLLYVQPLYLQSSTTALPQIQRVIVFYRSPSSTPNLPTGQQQNVVMAPTLGEALAHDLRRRAAARDAADHAGRQAGARARRRPPTAALIKRANDQYAAAQAALRAGDLSTFAKAHPGAGEDADAAQDGALSAALRRADRRSSPRDRLSAPRLAASWRRPTNATDTVGHR